MEKNLLKAAVVGALLGGVTPAVQAGDIIPFDPAGGGAYVDIGSFD